jgi:beta-mannosidase
MMAWHASGEFGADQVAWVESPNAVFPANRLFFAEIKDVPFLRPTLDVAVTETGEGTATLEITSDRFAYFVHVLTPDPGVRFTDNYLDLRPGHVRRIGVSGLAADLPASSLSVLPYAGLSEGS